MKLILSALQWAFFILAGSLVEPISIAASYGLEGADALAFVQRTLFVLGLAGILQALLGRRLPFLVGSFFIILISLFPGVTAIFAVIPAAVGYAALFPIFSDMIGLAFREYAQVEDKEQLYRITGLSLFTGMGIMFIPAQAFSSFPPFLASFLSNGLILGVVIVLVLDSTLSHFKQKELS